MKRKMFLSLLALVCVGGAAFFGFSGDAANQTFEQRFLIIDDKKPKQEPAPSGAYNFDKAHSAIGFRVKHMGLVDVHGYFRDFTGTINYDSADVTKSTVEFTAKMTSVDTGNAGRDNHLRTKDFFEVETYPEMTFKSTSVTKKGKTLMLTGDLTMKGVKKTVTFPFNVVGSIKDQRGTLMGVTAETVINRRDFGVNYGTNLPNGVPSLSDNITVVLQIEARMPVPKPAVD